MNNRAIRPGFGSLPDIPEQKPIQNKAHIPDIPEWRETEEQRRLREAVEHWPLADKKNYPDAQLLEDVLDDIDIRQLIADNWDEKLKMGERISKHIKGKWTLALREAERKREPDIYERAASLEQAYREEQYADRMEHALEQKEEMRVGADDGDES